MKVTQWRSSDGEAFHLLHSSLEWRDDDEALIRLFTFWMRAIYSGEESYIMWQQPNLKVSWLKVIFKFKFREREMERTCLDCAHLRSVQVKRDGWCRMVDSWDQRFTDGIKLRVYSQNSWACCANETSNGHVDICYSLLAAVEALAVASCRHNLP